MCYPASTHHAVVAENRDQLAMQQPKADFDAVKSSEETAYKAGVRGRVKPQPVEYIEARGFLCHELQLLLSGRVEYRMTSWRQFRLKVFEFIVPIMPICRWYPPEDCRLEMVAYGGTPGAKAYRLRPRDGQPTAFFVDYLPEPPILGHIRALYMVPRLDLDFFMRPPLVSGSDKASTIMLQRTGDFQRLTPLVAGEALEYLNDVGTAMRRGMWKALCEDVEESD
jgi:hypothetical protein